MNQENKTPHSFCETPEEKCTMNYCDENGCQNRKRHLVEENKQLPTAYEIMDEYGCRVDDSSVFLAMEEYKDLHTAPLREELEKLRSWKESAMKTLSDVGLHECGKLLNIGLGQSIADKIVPGIKEIKAENERLRKDISDYSSQVCDLQDEQETLNNENYGIMVENQKLRKALVRISNEEIASDEGYWDTLDRIRMIAKEALKGGDNNGV